MKNKIPKVFLKVFVGGGSTRQTKKKAYWAITFALGHQLK